MSKKKVSEKNASKINEAVISNREYARLLENIKTDILQTQLNAALAVTKELTLLYWRIGKTISVKMSAEGWGTKVVERLAQDLRKSFPGIAGFSLRNLRYMRTFAEVYDNENVATAVARIPWGHNIAILEKLQSNDQRLWYTQQTIENGWSRATLAMWIESDLYSRQGKAITNFKTTLPEPHSDLAEQTLKDPYNFAFLTIDKKAREREIELGLMSHIQNFLLELGQGFAFIGRQFPILWVKKIFLLICFFIT